MRGEVRLAKLSVLFCLALLTASTLTLISPRPASAEGPLLGTVRCLVRTLFWTECKHAPTAPAQPTPAPATPAPSQSSQTPAQQPPQSGQSSQSAQSPPSYSDGSLATDVAPIDVELPKAVEQVPSVQSVPHKSSAGRMQQSDYVAYFNKHSPYAVLGAQQQAESQALIAQTPEGWRIFGVSWYWWAAVIVSAALCIPAVRRFIFRKSSVLLNK